MIMILKLIYSAVGLDWTSQRLWCLFVWHIVWRQNKRYSILLSYDVNYSLELIKWIAVFREPHGICRQFMQHRINCICSAEAKVLMLLSSFCVWRWQIDAGETINERKRWNASDCRGKKISWAKEKGRKNKSVNILNKWLELNELARHWRQTFKPTQSFRHTHSHSHIHTHLIAQYITTDSRLLNSHIREGNVETAIHSFIQFHSVPFVRKADAKLR